MVSTRQMATSSGSGSGASNNNAITTISDEAARPSVVTRQTTSSSNYELELKGIVNCAAMPPLSVQRNFTNTVVASSSSSSSTSLIRHSQLTQALKASGSSATSIGYHHNNDSNFTPHLLDLPIEILSKIFGYCDFKKISHMRLTSPKVNDVCMHILNSTFSKLITQTFNRFQAIKANMPRRESARRNHPLSCECDIIETCYMRLSLLQMTFGKHIERGHCCFFPGAILDEVYTILKYIKNTPNLERPYRVTDELFDLSTMAMEYFRDQIEPKLPGLAYLKNEYYQMPISAKGPTMILADVSDLSDSPSSSPPQSNMVLRKGIRKIKQGMKIYNNQLSVLRNELRTCKRKSSEQGKQIAEQQKLLAEQQKQAHEYATRLDENDKKNEEMARKFSTLLQELNKCKTELQYWRSKSPAISTCTSCGQKVASMLPLEDYQALINQGVKPEDIILTLNDDTDAESDRSSINENNLSLSSEFVFPDETTTAKLLAVNVATKNLKRHHASMSNTNTNTSFNSNYGGGNGNDESLLSCIQAPSTSGSVTSEITNCLAFAKGGGIIRTTCSAITAQDLNDDVVADGGGGANAFDNNSSSSNSNNTNINAAAVVGATNATVAAHSGGYPTKLFYGTSAAHKGVIVTPSMLAKMEMAPQIMQAIENAGNVGDATATGVATAAGGGGGVIGVESVATLQSIASHETKKARRVQKATRCLNGSGKRSK